MREKIFIELYLDEDVSVLIAELIRARGFSAVTSVEAGNLGKNDREQLKFAADSQSVFLTHNRVDFEKLAVEYFEQGHHHAGIIIAARRPPALVALRPLTILGSTTGDEMIDQIRYI
jgi:hypothetical protein